MRRAFDTETTPVVFSDDANGQHSINDLAAWRVIAIVSSAVAWLNAREPQYGGQLDLFTGVVDAEVEFLRAYGEDAEGQIIDLSWDEFAATDA